MKNIFLTLTIALVCCSISKAQWLPSGTTSGPIYYNGGNVGIGTTTPNALLHVEGITQTKVVSFTEGNNPIGFLGRAGSTTGGYSNVLDAFALTYFTRDFVIGGWSKTSHLWTGVSLYINSDNNYVGIGTINPGAILSVAVPSGKTISGGNIAAFLSTNDSSNAFGLRTMIYGAPSIANRYVTLQTTDFGLLDGGDFVLQPATGNVLIGQTSQANTAYKLDINGYARANEIVVNITGADFVFDKKYKLPKIKDVKFFLDKNHHLPEIASADEMSKNGAALGQLNIKLLQKVEELTLYIIEKDKQLDNQQQQINVLSKKMNALTKAKPIIKK